MKRVLFVNGCVRKASRTKRLADALLQKLGGVVEQLNLSDVRFPISDDDFIKRRDELIDKGQFDDPLFNLARQFARADTIVLAVPFWDLSFPAAFKQYIEHINVRGITFTYTEDGYPKGLCKAGKLYYVTTAGGDYFPQEFGFGYVKALSESFYGIRDVELVMAKGLDIVGSDPERIIDDAIKALN